MLVQRFYYQDLVISVQEECSQATAAGHGLLVEPNDFAARFGAIWGFLWLRAMTRRQLNISFSKSNHKGCGAAMVERGKQLGSLGGQPKMLLRFFRAMSLV